MTGSMRYLALVAAFFCVGVAEARDSKLMISIEEAMATPDAKAKLDQGVRFYFGDQAHGEIETSSGTFTSNKKTNGVGKSDREACMWAFLSAMLSFQDRVKAEGGNAVVNLRSYYRRNEISSTTEFECGAGNIMAGVTFRGEVVKLTE